ncbi:unnamed protein product [Paramecium primaurelia]|uniref:Uncharacterized protein n=1 Tax=Paramecium primaurelia TaxID=5886 RepID=A0A8S1K7K6_PARPR|nr:unnamed protein product [Paramecium primaurelia]
MKFQFNFFLKQRVILYKNKLKTKKLASQQQQKNTQNVNILIYQYVIEKTEEPPLAIIKFNSKSTDLGIERVKALALNEKNILSITNHPFIIKMLGTCQDQRSLYLIQENVNYGSLRSLISIKNKLENNQAVFYAAQVVLALEYLHTKDILYRGLDAELILIGSDGYIKLDNFSYAKQTKKKTYTFISNLNYLPPENMQTQGHWKPVDFYSLGILIYQMLEGKFPFSEDISEQCFQKVKGQYQFTQNFSQEAKSLVSGLLQPNYLNRLGSLKGGFNDIKMHKWFKDINWKELEQKKIKPIFQPNPDETIYKNVAEEQPTNIQKQIKNEPNQNYFQGW